jgi:signal transduction histidine kinase/CheY-like chemotaxis protein
MYRMTALAINTELGMDRTVILLPAERPHVYRPAHFEGFAEEESERLAEARFVFPEEFATGAGLLVVNKSTDETSLQAALRTAFKVPSFLCVPVMGSRSPSSLIFSGRLLEDLTFFQPLNQGDVDTFRAIAGVLEAAAQNARLVVLEESHRLKSEFFANVSHEFRTPLTLTLGPLAQILEGRWGELPAAVEERLRIVERSQQRLVGLIDQILELARLEAGAAKLRPAPLPQVNDLVRDCAAQFRPALDARGLELRLSLDPAAEAADFFGDREKLERLLFNLLSNALKFTETGYIEVATRYGADSLEIVVTDAGIGIESAELSHIFDRFHRAVGGGSPPVPGAGIGLALVKEIAELHRGRVMVASQKGKGSRFTVELPLGRGHLSESADAAGSVESASFHRSADGALPGSEPPPAPDESTATHAANRRAEATFDPSRPVVLHVDDDPDVRAYVRDVLGPDYNLFVAANGSEGRECARRYLPDLIIADQMMPGMDGRELLRVLRSDGDLRAIPLLFLTARFGTEVRIESLNAGADDYLTKPFHEAELRARVRNLIQARRSERRLAELNRSLEIRVRQQMAELLRTGELRRLLPPQVIESVLRGGLEPGGSLQRRDVTVLVADFRRSTTDAGKPDPEKLAADLSDYLGEVAVIAAARGGTVDSLAGGRASIVFGAPDPCPPGVGAWSAVEAAMQMRVKAEERCASARRRGVAADWQTRIGLSSGTCVVGAFGGDLLRMYTAVGCAADEAAAVQAQAPPGAIVLGKPTWELVRSRVRVQRLESPPGSHGRGALEAYELRDISSYTDTPHPEMSARAAEPRGVIHSVSSRLFRREGDYWTVAYAGTVCRLKDSKGLHYLARLLAQPHDEMHALDLIGALWNEESGWNGNITSRDLVTAGLTPSRPGDAGAILDSKAKARYRERLLVLREELKEAEGSVDRERTNRAKEEMAALAHELSAAVGLGGRNRKAAAATERARVNVTRTIKVSIDRIAASNAALGRHLSATIRTGTFCSYEPSRGEEGQWEL